MSSYEGDTPGSATARSTEAARRRLRRSRRGKLPPSIILVNCAGTKHRISLPRRGPVVLFDHHDCSDAEFAQARSRDDGGCLQILRYVRFGCSYNSYGWYQWAVHFGSKYGGPGWAIILRLREFDERRKLRRLLRCIDLD
jgi:hypothetical protein